MTQASVHLRHKDEAAKIWSQIEANGVPVIAQTLANLEAARADLAEIARLLAMKSCSACDDARDIAAPYRASDPVAEALSSIMGTLGIGTTPTGGKWEDDPDWPAALAKFRAIIERTEDGK